MLYDILPPLFLLASFGGIIVIISRVVVRVQRQRLSEELKAHAVAAAESTPSEDLLRSRGSRISMVTNRLFFVPRMAASVAQGMKGFAQRRKLSATKAAGAGVQALRSGVTKTGQLTSGVRTLTGRSRETLQALRDRRQKTVQEKAEAPVPPVDSQEAQPARVRRIELPQTNTGTGDQKMPASRMRKMLSRKPDDDPLKQAAVCLKESQYDKAEDILLPYIVRHSRDTNAYMLLGRSALGRGDWTEAIEIFQQVRAIDEKTSRLFSSLGTAAFKAGRFTLAVEALQKARDFEPNNISVREQLLKIAQRMDNEVLRRSVQEELGELRQQHTAAEPKERQHSGA